VAVEPDGAVHWLAGQEMDVALKAPAEAIADAVVQSGQPFSTGRLAGDKRVGEAVEAAVVGWPLMANGVLVGVLVGFDHGRARRSPRFTPAFRLALAHLVEPAGFALAHALRVARAEALSVTDDLTQLYNSRYLYEVLRKETKRSARSGRPLSLLFVDLDGFKLVNDSLGHLVGDQLLVAFGQRLKSCVRPGDTVARLGGDEFVVVQTGIHGRDDAQAFADRLTSALIARINFKGQEIGATFSVGIALAPDDGRDPERLLKSADLALYKAKADGRNCTRFFLPAMDSELQARLELENMIREAVLHEGFQVHFRPLYEMADRRLIGFEALIRMTKEDGTLVPPLTFIPVAEDMRLIDRIGTWVLREACRIAMTWPDHLTVAVNLSPAQFTAGSVSEMVAAALKETGLAAHRLELEITETLLLGDSEAIMAELHTLKAMGVAIVMDDFGTGYSSLSYLWRFPFDKIKIDRAFVVALDDAEGNGETVLRAIVGLGRALGLQVTVEGVETARQLAFLRELRVHQIQGFYFGRPMPARQVAAAIMADFHRASAALPAEVARRA
jgi:diguanylate cyclase (GGDEF)-like protein